MKIEYHERNGEILTSSDKGEYVLKKYLENDYWLLGGTYRIYRPPYGRWNVTRFYLKFFDKIHEYIVAEWQPNFGYRWSEIIIFDITGIPITLMFDIPTLLESVL